MSFIDRYRQARRDVIARDADKLDQKHVRKALRVAPESPVLIARVIGHRNAQMLAGRGWEIQSSRRSQWGGSDLWAEFVMEKPNPNF